MNVLRVKMGGIMSTKSIVTKEDKAVLKVKGVRDRVSIYQKKADAFLIHERILVKQLVKDGKLEKAKSVLKKSLVTQEHLKATDFYLEQIENIIYSLDHATMQQKVAEALKLGNSALRKAENILNIEHLDRILLDSIEGEQKQREIEETLKVVEVQGQLDETLEKEIANISGNPKPARNLYKKALKLKTIHMPKSSTSLAIESQVKTASSQTMMEELQFGRNRLSSLSSSFQQFIKGLTSSAK